MTKLPRLLALLALLPSLAAAQQDVTHKRDPIEVFARGMHGGVKLDTDRSKSITCVSLNAPVLRRVAGNELLNQTASPSA